MNRIITWTCLSCAVCLLDAVRIKGAHRCIFRFAIPAAWMAVPMIWLAMTSGLSASQLVITTSRSSWEQALLGGTILKETFNEFDEWAYNPLPGVGAYQLPAGITTIGLLSVEVQRESGTLVLQDTYPYGTIDGTNFLRVEASTQNGEMSPLTPTLIFDPPAFGFGADFASLNPNTTLSIGTETLRFGDYLGPSGFLGVIAPFEFDHAVFALTTPFNTLFKTDNVSFAVVPEPSTFTLALTAILAMFWILRGHDERGEPIPRRLACLREPRANVVMSHTQRLASILTVGGGAMVGTLFLAATIREDSPDGAFLGFLYTLAMLPAGIYVASTTQGLSRLSGFFVVGTTLPWVAGILWFVKLLLSERPLPP